MGEDGSRCITELLVRIGDEYRHVRGEHEREGENKATRRRLARRMARIAARYERLLGQWVRDGALRRAWERFLHKGGLAPDAPLLAPPPAFKGIDQVGSVVEVRLASDGGYDVIVDGTIARHEMVPWHLDPDQHEPIQIGEHTCRELFDAPREAVNALARFQVTRGAEPPWRWARALVEDGLVDPSFALTPRGERRLARGVARVAGAGEGISIGVLVADAARARVLVLGGAATGPVPTLARLAEVAAVTRPERRTRDSELLSDTRPGLRREGPFGPRHGVSDRRERHRRTGDRELAALAVAEAVDAWRAHAATRIVLAASPTMLGLLRRALARENGGQKPFGVRELARDLTRLAPPALHDALAAAGLLPPRGRLSPPGHPVRGTRARGAIGVRRRDRFALKPRPAAPES